MLDQGFDALVDPGATYIVIRMYYGMLKLVPIANLSEPRDPLNRVDQQAMPISVRYGMYHFLPCQLGSRRRKLWIWSSYTVTRHPLLR